MDNRLAVNFWRRTITGSTDVALQSNWADEVASLYQAGIGLEEALQFLYFHRPGLEEFLSWIKSRQSDQSNTAITDKALSEAQLAFFDQHGYIVLQAAISPEEASKTQQVIYDFLGMSVHDPDSWYQVHPAQRGMMLQFSHHPQLQKNRESVRIYQAYTQLYGSEAIYKTIDKVSFNPPVHKNYNLRASPLHWDVSLKQPIAFRLQGLIYLSDCGPQDGAFHCVPGFHHQIEGWMANLPMGCKPREEALKTLRPVPITGQAGDMVIWHQALPHCATPNYGLLPRTVQYLSYYPVEYQEAEEWI